MPESAAAPPGDREADVLIVGGGIAGASAAYEIAAFASVVLLETEAACGYHSTGRSAAFYTENYGNALIRRLAMASRPFLESPPAGFADHPILSPRPIITIAREDQLDALKTGLERARVLVLSIEAIDPAEALRRVPILRPEAVAGAFLEPHSMEIDVNALHQGFLRGAKARGARIITETGVQAIGRRGSRWMVETQKGVFRAAILVNAAGAWADAVAALAGVPPLGLTPKRRTAFHVAAPEGVDVSGWPMVLDAEERFYFKPDAGRIFASPADATPSEPMDAYPEDLDIAIGVDRLERATTLKVTHIPHSWAGLRTFAADNSPVVGPDPQAEGFVWLAGQGGYGIKTSPALSRAVAGLLQHGEMPADLLRLGIDPAELLPGRLRQTFAA
jgi:D-arginine dehydrogenase